MLKPDWRIHDEDTEAKTDLGPTDHFRTDHGRADHDSAP